MPKGSLRPSLNDVEPELGRELEIVGRPWLVTDHSSYRNSEGYHVDEWECEHLGAADETAYLLRETGDSEGLRWFFTRPIPISAITLEGGRPFADVAASLTAPPDALVYRDLAYGFDEQTDGTYSEDPGDEVGKTTWDYWDAKEELNLAVERWADGRVDCYHGRVVDPAKIRVRDGGSAASDLHWVSRIASADMNPRGMPPAGQIVLAVIVFGFFAVFATAMRNALVDGVTVLFAALALFLGRSLFGSVRSATAWLAAIIVLAAAFSRFPPLSTLAGLLLLAVVPALVALWLATSGDHRGLVRNAGIAAGIATAFAGLYHFYAFAPPPPSWSQYGLAVGPAPIAALVGAAIAFAVGRLSGGSA